MSLRSPWVDSCFNNCRKTPKLYSLQTVNQFTMEISITISDPGQNLTQDCGGIKSKYTCWILPTENFLSQPSTIINIDE